MKKIIFASILLFSVISGIYAQDIDIVLNTIPDDIIFGLEAEEKARLLGNPDDTSVIVVESKLYNKMKRLAISSDFISIQTSEAGTTQIKLLGLINDSKIVCVVKTIKGDKISDSQIQFYTTKWAPISQSTLFPPKNKEWFIKSDADRNSEEFKNAYAALNMTPMKIELSPENESITVSYEIKNYLSKEDYEKVKPFLTDNSKVFSWDKNSFK